MNEIELMLTGKIEMSEFIALLHNDQQIQDAIKNLIPSDITGNIDADLWKLYSYEALKKYNFDLLELLTKMFRFDGSIADNLNIFGTINTIYCYFNPEVVSTKQYIERFDLYLDAVKDCYDGPEVQHIIEQIIQDALKLSGKNKRIDYAKQRIKETFSITNKLPRWIQGPMWPMGCQSPMRFVSQKRCEESVKYQFEDIDNGTIKTVIQYY